MASAKSEHPTMHEVLSSVQLGKGKSTKLGGKSVVEGKRARTFARREGEMILTPAQLLSVRVPFQRVRQGEIIGYQRALNIADARNFAQYLEGFDDDGYLKETEVADISLTDGMPFATDGEHRIAGAIIANKPLRVLVTKRSMSEAKRRFANQAKARRVNRNVLIFDSEGVYEEYIQDAVTSRDHPWHKLIAGGQTGTRARISAATALNLLKIYVGRSAGSGPISPEAAQRFDKDVADGMAELLLCFGTKATNPYAFGSSPLRAIANTARLVFREQKPKEGDRERWKRHMPLFPFAQYLYLRSARDLTDQLVRWWNKGLPQNRRITP